ncbi:hypothetical protein FFI94_016335 [Rhodococcus sp. KBS0724]|jgi:hypothetical protein|uniref:hypothetical protein n=1 Tax=Rhodococcus sp. KBS0724 TaxID=1179674 RepID=UPI00110E6365|nr:hypothetical protein [Rhodococcus sp. KBS0724]TSD47547.1 hypothetical protein FFI94_016335 [Rhodococcus sp. KBS0724]
MSSGFHEVGARIAPLGKWPLEAAFLGWYPGQEPNTDSLDNEHPLRIIPSVGVLSEVRNECK